MANIETTDVKNPAVEIFRRMYGYDPFACLKDGGTIWLHRTGTYGFIFTILTLTVFGVVLGDFDAFGLTAGWPKWMAMALYAIFFGAIGVLARIVFRGNGLGISSQSLSLRRGWRPIEQMPTASVDFVLGIAAGWSTAQWEKLRIECGRTVFRIGDLTPWESETAYQLLIAVCGRAMAIRPDGQIDLGTDLVPENHAQWAQPVRERIRKELGIQLATWLVGSLLCGTLAIALIVYSTHIGQQSLQAVTEMLAVLGVGLIVGIYRVYEISRRRKSILGTISAMENGQAYDVGVFHSQPPPPPDFVSSLGRILTALALITCWIPVIGSVFALMALSATRKRPGTYRRMAIVSVIISTSIVVLLAATVIIINLVKH